MLRNAILGAAILIGVTAMPAAAQYVELGAAARHQMMVQVQTTPGAAEAARPWIAEDQQVQLAAAQPRRPRFSFRAPRD